MDIRNAFPRFVHKINGFELPEHFYKHEYLTRGQVKKQINTVLNDLSVNVESYKHNRRQKGFKTSETQIKKFIKNKKQKDRSTLREFGFNETIINWLISTYSNNPNRGELFKLLSYHERELIKLANKSIAENNFGTKYFSVRKHDAILFFYNEVMTFESGKSIKYLDSEEWF